MIFGWKIEFCILHWEWAGKGECENFLVYFIFTSSIRSISILSSLCSQNNVIKFNKMRSFTLFQAHYENGFFRFKMMMTTTEETLNELHEFCGLKFFLCSLELHFNRLHFQNEHRLRQNRLIKIKSLLLLGNPLFCCSTCSSSFSIFIEMVYCLTNWLWQLSVGRRQNSML